MIAQILDSCSNVKIRDELLFQKDRFLQWQQSKRLSETISVGNRVDVRDRAYVWCKGIVKMVVESQHRDAILVVGFEGF